MAHAKYSPSASKRWLTCPASISRTAALVAEIGEQPDNSSYASLEGTTAHSLGQVALESGCSAQDAMLLTEAEPGVEITDEMAAFVQEYVTYVEKVVDDLYGDLFVEVKLPLEGVTGEKDAHGTSDAIVLSMDRKTMYVIDLKYGAGIRVRAPYNTQAMIYALAALQYIEGASEVENIVLSIVQPRNGGVDEWSATREYLKGFAEIVRDKVVESQEPDPPAHPDPEACRWCDVKTRCAELANWNAQTVTKACASQFPDMDAEDATAAMFDCIAPGTGQDAAKALFGNDALAMLPHLHAWCGALTAYAIQLVEAGTYTGAKLVDGTPVRRWSDPEAVRAIFKTAGVRDADATRKVPFSPDEVQGLVRDGTIGSRTWKKLQDLVVEQHPPKKLIWLTPV